MQQTLLQFLGVLHGFDQNISICMVYGIRILYDFNGITSSMEVHLSISSKGAIPLEVSFDL